MSFDAAIFHKKTKRKPYRGSRAFDYSCRAGGSCKWCQSNRQHFDTRRRIEADHKLKHWKEEIEWEE